MIGKSSLIVLGSVVVTALFSDQAFAQCQGNACGDLVIQQQGGCIVLVNRNPNRAIKIISNAVPSTVYEPKSIRTDCRYRGPLVLPVNTF